MMEFIRTIREKSQSKREETIQKEAESRIRIADFDSTLYIAYDGTPLVAIEKDWATDKIIERLSAIRQNYIKSRTKDSLRTAMF